MAASPNHSPSRERVDRYAGRLRRYFRDNPLERRKVFYTLLAVCSTTLLLGIFTLTGSDRPYSHGPVASVHISFDANCDACHRPQSIGSIGPSAIDPQSRWLDLTCQKCHGGPDHHATATWPKDWPGGGSDGKPDRDNDRQCAACHHDHNGKDFSLVRIEDSHCTKCHADLTGHAGAAPPFEPKVTTFAGHPEFAKLKKDLPDRALKFSHAHHMSAGIAYAAPGRGKMTKADILANNPTEPKIADRYKYTADNGGLVQLDCASCHQLDGGHAGAPRLQPGRPDAGKAPWDAFLSGDPKASILPPRAEGAYYLPINYEAHCQACHPLQSPRKVTVSGKEFAPFYLPHRKQPKELEEVLRARYSALVLSTDGKPELMDKDATDPEVRTVGREVNDAVKAAVRKLVSETNPKTPNAISGSTCFECHKTTGDAAKLEIRPPNLPTVWLEHAKFNHVSHRSYNCVECHPNTSPKEGGPKGGGAVFDWKTIYTVNDENRKTTDQLVNIEGVKSCQECHNSGAATMKEGKSRGGVRSNCTDCHRYHNGDNPFQGRGAIPRDPPEPPQPR